MRVVVIPLVLVVATGGLVMMGAGGPKAVEGGWERTAISGEFLTEGCATGDLDGDGAMDVVAGAFWFKGPDFKSAIRYRKGELPKVNGYAKDSFLSWTHDMDDDGDADILMVGWPGKEVTWYENPRGAGDWKAHLVVTEMATECPAWEDLDGDGKPELAGMSGGCFGFATVDWKDPAKPWKFTRISKNRSSTPYVHGLGTGDLNGDSRIDVVEKDGWFEQGAEGGWEWHEYRFADRGGAQMLVFDVDGDGDNDVVSSLNGHGYGLAWFENRTGDGKVELVRHEVLPEDPAGSGAGGLQFSQLHALALGDFDGDGRQDFVTGKRYFAHNGKDPGSSDPAVLVVFFNRQVDGKVEWLPQMVDGDSGVGCQVVAADMDGDKLPEIVVGNKKGVFHFRALK